MELFNVEPHRNTAVMFQAKLLQSTIQSYIHRSPQTTLQGEHLEPMNAVLSLVRDKHNNKFLSLLLGGGPM